MKRSESSFVAHIFVNSNGNLTYISEQRSLTCLKTLLYKAFEKRSLKQNVQRFLCKKQYLNLYFPKGQKQVKFGWSVLGAN